MVFATYYKMFSEYTDILCMQIVLHLGYNVVWSDMDTVWLQNFLDLTPRGQDYVGVDDSVEEDEQARTDLALYTSLEKWN